MSNKIVFSPDPEIVTKKSKNNQPTLASLDKETVQEEQKKVNPDEVEPFEEEQQPAEIQAKEQKTPQLFNSTQRALKHFEHEEKVIFENMREKWIYNATKKFDEDHYDDRIEVTYKSLKAKDSYKWLDEANQYASSSADPYAALLSKVIDNKVKANSESTLPFAANEVNNLSATEVLDRLFTLKTSVTDLDSDFYIALRKKAIRFICDEDAFALSMIRGGELGKNPRFLNLMTDIFVNTYAPNAANPHECLRDFKILSFLLFDPEKTLAHKEYNLALQGMLAQELFSAPGHLSSIKGKYTNSFGRADLQ